jgi:small subunit ribosomal protein S4
MGLADSRKEARQLVTHSHFMLNGKSVNVPNTILRVGDEVTVRPKSQKAVPFMRSMENAKKRETPDWLEFNPGEFKGKIKYLPERNHVTIPIEENLVVELYSR